MGRGCLSSSVVLVDWICASLASAGSQELHNKFWYKFSSLRTMHSLTIDNQRIVYVCARRECDVSSTVVRIACVCFVFWFFFMKKTFIHCFSSFEFSRTFVVTAVGHFFRFTVRSSPSSISSWTTSCVCAIGVKRGVQLVFATALF